MAIAGKRPEQITVHYRILKWVSRASRAYLSPDRRLAALVFQRQLRHGLSGCVGLSEDLALSGVEHRLAAKPRPLGLRSVDASLAASADHNRSAYLVQPR